MYRIIRRKLPRVDRPYNLNNSPPMRRRSIPSVLLFDELFGMREPGISELRHSCSIPRSGTLPRHCQKFLRDIHQPPNLLYYLTGCVVNSSNRLGTNFFGADRRIMGRSSANVCSELVAKLRPSDRRADGCRARGHLLKRCPVRNRIASRGALVPIVAILRRGSPDDDDRAVSAVRCDSAS